MKIKLPSFSKNKPRAQSPSINSEDARSFFLILTVVFGLAVRLFPVIKEDFPLVDGGMFYSMIIDLQASNFSLPLFTSYNHAQIPFAYPPLAFYLAGLLGSAFKISTLALLRWLPVIITTLNIPLFYFLSRNFLNSEPLAALSTLIFALTPNSYWWNIVGGGLTRSLGTLFFTATILCAHQMFQRGSTKWVVGTIISGAGCVLSHPAWAAQAVIASLLLFLFFGRDKQGMKLSAIVALCIFCITALWWLPVIQNHGIGTLLNAGQEAQQRWMFWTVFFALSFTGEYAPVIGVLGLLGFFIHLARKEFLLVAWVLSSLIFDPRGGLPVSIFPFSMMAAVALAEGIGSQMSGSINTSSWLDVLSGWSGRLFWGFFILLFTYNAFQVSNTLSFQRLNSEERKSIEWVKKNIAPESQFLILDQQGNPLLSPLTEWFPALSERRSIATIQGTEWLNGSDHYAMKISAIREVHECLYQGVGCLTRTQGQLADRYDYILLSGGEYFPLLTELSASTDFLLIYESGNIHIFKKNE